jgi:hypothetical protein
MTTMSRTRTADDLPGNVSRTFGIPNRAVEFRTSRAFLVFVLTPALIFFMSRKAIDRVQTSADAKPQAFEQWPAPDRSPVDSPVHARTLAVAARYDVHSPSADLIPTNVIYARAMFLARNYDSRPYWNHPKLEIGAPTTLATADLAIEHLIPCESMGKPINRIDTNGKMSYGILQFQDWDEWERVSGITGDPDNRADAIRMAEWAIQNGMINHWTCATILKML